MEFIVFFFNLEVQRSFHNFYRKLESFKWGVQLVKKGQWVNTRNEFQDYHLTGNIFVLVAFP